MSEILKKENILTNCKPEDKETVIRKMGAILLENGYIEEPYIQGMVDKEEVFNTNIGNEVAIPHGIESAREYIKKTGIAVMVFPEGTDWGNGEKVKVVIGIAGVGEEHMDILSKIAEILSEPEDVEKVVNSSTEEIYKLFVED